MFLFFFPVSGSIFRISLVDLNLIFMTTSLYGRHRYPILQVRKVRLGEK